MAGQESEIDKIRSRLSSLELRMSRLESGFIITGKEKSDRIGEMVQADGQVNISETLDEEEKGLESQIGRFGLAWLGNIVLLFGITFLTQYLTILEHPLLAALLGYTTAGSIFFLSEYIKNTNSHLSFMFKMNVQIILYYVTIRLHFFSMAPLLSNKALSVILLLLIVAFQVYLSIRNKSQAYAVLAVLFALATAIIGDSTHFMLLLVTFTAAGTIFYLNRFNWKPLLIVTIILTYTCFFLWLFGNPFMGHPMQLIPKQHFGVLYLFGLGTCYSIVLLFRKKDNSSDDFLIGVTLTNGILFTFPSSACCFKLL
jgi:hypothetical protein